MLSSFSVKSFVLTAQILPNPPDVGFFFVSLPRLSSSVARAALAVFSWISSKGVWLKLTVTHRLKRSANMRRSLNSIWKHDMRIMIQRHTNLSVSSLLQHPDLLMGGGVAIVTVLTVARHDGPSTVTAFLPLHMQYIKLWFLQILQVFLSFDNFLLAVRKVLILPGFTPTDKIISQSNTR